MGENVFKFRRVKWGDPEKLKVLSEDLKPPRPSRLPWLMVPLVLGTAALVGYNADRLDLSALSALSLSSECRIKGNSRGGERIYHMPGDAYYAKTRVTWWRGERWFCSAGEAEAAGFRRSKV